MSKRKIDIGAVMPPLLVKRIKEYGIPPCPGQATYERVLVYQIPDEMSSRTTFAKGGSIIMPETTQSVKKERSPRGIIVSAGLKAMDIMRDHGMQLGEMVWYSPHVPTRFEVDRKADGERVMFYFMNVGDVIVSEDVPERLASGELRLQYKNGVHTYSGGERRDPAEFDDSI